jgi:hypothetical protein
LELFISKYFISEIPFGVVIFLVEVQEINTKNGRMYFSTRIILQKYEKDAAHLTH